MADNLSATLDSEWQNPSWPPSDASETAPDVEETKRSICVEYWRERITHPYVRIYDRLVKMNCTPRVAVAVTHYIAVLDGNTTQKTQAEIAAQYDVCTTTIRNWYPVVTEGRPPPY